MPPRRTPIARELLSPDEARPLIEMMNTYGLTEVEVERGGVRIRLRRDAAHAAATHVVQGAARPAAEPRETVPAGLHTIEAPMVGTFYRAPSPDTPPFVSEGDPIKEGQPLCIIEAMKLMNEIEAKITGRVVKILVENGQPVEYGQPLFLVEPLP